MKRFMMFAALSGCVASPPSEVLIHAGRVFDGVGNVTENQDILVRDGLIVAVTPSADAPAPSGALIVDARDKTVMPGLINAHTHIFTAGACKPGVGEGIGPAVRNLRALVSGGVTTIAELAAPAYASVGLRSYAGVGEQRGPRVLVAGPMLSSPGGYMTDVFDGRLVEAGAVRSLDSIDDARRTVQQLAEAGVDFLKVGLQEYNYDLTPLSLMPKDILCALVDEAHTQELRVLAHAATNQAYELALSCGVDAFVHGLIEPMRDDILARVLEKKSPVAPTLFVFEALLYGPSHLSEYDNPALRRALDDTARATYDDFAKAFAQSGEFFPTTIMPNIPKARTAKAAADNVENTRRMQQAGLRLGMGTDGGLCMNPLGSPILELLRLQAAGLSPREVLTAATSGSARLVGLEDALGRVAPNYRADLVVVAGKPDEDLEAVTRVERVFIDGIEQSLAEPGLFASLAATAHVAWTYLRQ